MGRRLSRGLVGAAAGVALAAGGLAGPVGAARVAHSTTRAFIQRLYGVTTLSRSDAWAVGLTPDSSLILHWNGRAWSQSQAGAGDYIGVGADSATDVWAVGGTNRFSPTQTLAEHWNGTAWARVPSPSPACGGPARWPPSRPPTRGRSAWPAGAGRPVTDGAADRALERHQLDNREVPRARRGR